MQTGTSLEEMILQWNEGDNRTFNLMYPELERIVETSLKIRHVRASRGYYEDIRQECWIEVMKNLKRWDPQRGSVRNFLISCCTNRILKFIFSHQKRDVLELSLEIRAAEAEAVLMQPALNLGSDDLDVDFNPRLRGFRVDYITRRVFIAMFYEVFEVEKKKIFSELLEVTRLSKRKLAFLMDYACVAIRLHLISRAE